MRIGTGYDVHRLEIGRRLILGGVNIPFALGLQGHSDADVLVHAICDALLGAAALGDIGKHFPDSDPAYKDADSLLLLAEVGKKLAQLGFTVVNIDSTVIAQQPRLAGYITEMRANIAHSLGLDIEQISVKATTTERLGFEGRQEGISAQAVVLIE
jgi:2-C-methyl-D-erythritol 2,4-cyclodiphosphate synthase